MIFIVLAELWPVLERCTVIAKKAVLYLGSYGLASWLWGTIFIDRKNSNAHNKVNSTVEIINKRKVYNCLIISKKNSVFYDKG